MTRRWQLRPPDVGAEYLPGNPPVYLAAMDLLRAVRAGIADVAAFESSWVWFL